MSRVSKAAEVVQQGNFRKLYKKQYGDIAKLGGPASMTPEQVFDMAVAYFEWAESNAIKAIETASFQGAVDENLVHKTRVFTLNGLSLFLNVSSHTLQRWRKEPGYAEVMEFIDGVVYEQKFQLAANGIVNASFIGKELGIDKPATVHVETVAAAAAGSDSEKMKDAVKSVLGEIGL